MKKSAKFEIAFYRGSKQEKEELEVNNRCFSSYFLDGRNLFRPVARPESGPFGTAGAVVLTDIPTSVGKKFSLVIPSGKLSGTILSVDRKETGNQVLAIVIDGQWTGATQALLCGESAVATFMTVEDAEKKRQADERWNKLSWEERDVELQKTRRY